jgi:hypothetical protein
MELTWTEIDSEHFEASQVNKRIMSHDRATSFAPAPGAGFLIVKMGGEKSAQPFYQAYYCDANCLPDGVVEAEQFLVDGGRWYAGGSNSLDDAKEICEEVCRQQRPGIEDRLNLLEVAVAGLIAKLTPGGTNGR